MPLELGPAVEGRSPATAAPASDRPVLLVTVDTEEEFDWSAPFSSANRSVRHVAELPRLQEVFDECGVRPTYVVDHPVATTDESIRVLATIQQRGGCEIGAHLHPWVNPPHREAVNTHNSYLCNLPLALQREKLGELTSAIRNSFGVSPVSFKAGRYGLDFALLPTLAELGYRVDASVRALTDLGSDGGPNWLRHDPTPFWIDVGGAGPMLEVPMTVGFNRRPFAAWAAVHAWLERRAHAIRAVGVLWHTRLLRRIAFSPEEHGVRDLARLARVVARGPSPVLQLTLHSPSVGIGHTPYVRTAEQRVHFLATLRATLRFALRELGAVNRTLGECPAEFQVRAFSVRRL